MAFAKPLAVAAAAASAVNAHKSVFGSAGGAAYPLASLYGVGDVGWLLSGAASRLWTTDAGTTECAASGVDPVGLIENLAPASAVIVKQSTAANQAEFYVNDGVKAWKAGRPGAGNQRWMEANLPSFGQEFTLYVVERSLNRPWSVLMSVEDSPFAAYVQRSGSYVPSFYDSVGPFNGINSTGGGDSAIHVSKFVRGPDEYQNMQRGDGTMAQLVAAGNLTGRTSTYYGSGPNWTSNGTKSPLTTPVKIGGYNDNSAWDTETYFHFYISRALSLAEQELVEAQLITEFGGLT